MELINALSSPETQMNGNFQTLEWAQVYGRRVPVTTGLTWGYYGGVMWGGITVVDGTLTLTNTAANYIVVNKSTGAISTSTAATNWNDTATYARVYKVTTAAGVVSAVEDHRAGAGGIFAGAGGGGGGGSGVILTEDAEPASTIDGNQWFESDTGSLYMRYQNPDSTYTWIQTAGTTGQAGPASSVNAIINGDMMIWQRGTSFTPTGDIYSADRWLYAMNGAALHTVSRQTSVPTVVQAGRLFNFSLSASCTTANASLAAGNFTTLVQQVEGYNWAPCAQRACTLSFWVSATKTGIYCIALFNSGTDRSFVAEYTINAANTWELKVIAIPPSPSAGTWNYANGVGASVRWTLAAGSTYRGVAGWQTGLFLATANQVNATDAINNQFLLTGVDLRPGTFTAPQFVSRSFGEELALCQRYYEKSYNLSDNPGAITGVGIVTFRSTVQAPNPSYASISFKAKKRANPTVTGYSPVTGASGQWSAYFAAVDAAVTFQNNSEALVTAAIPVNDTEIVQGHWTADAEL